MLVYISSSCQPTNPGPMFGNIYIIEDEQVSDDKKIRLTLGPGTNTRADYLTLIYTLKYLGTRVVPLIIMSHSLLLINQVLGIWKTKDEDLLLLRDEAAALLKKNISLVYVTKKENLADKLIEYKVPYIPREKTKSTIPRGIMSKSGRMNY